MSQKKTTTKGGTKGKAEGSKGEAEEGTDGYTHTLWIEYRPVYYEDGKHVDNPPNDAVADGRLFAAAEGLKHAEALFRLLALVDGEMLERMQAADAAMMFESIGELGQRICGAVYTHVEESRRTLPV